MRSDVWFWFLFMFLVSCASVSNVQQNVQASTNEEFESDIPGQMPPSDDDCGQDHSIRCTVKRF